MHPCKRLSRALATLLAVLALLNAFGCVSSPEPEKKPKPLYKYKPPPPPPLDDLWRNAQQAEKIGHGAKSFSAVFGLDEAIRAYQQIRDHYPDSEKAQTARKKVASLGKKVREIREWKRKIDRARQEVAKRKKVPSKMHPLFEKIVTMAFNAPQGFIKNAVDQLLASTREAYQQEAMKEVEKAIETAKEARTRGDLREALQAFQTLPEAYGQDLPAVETLLSDERGALENEAAERAERDLEKARSALRRKKERKALVLLREAWKEFRGFEVVQRILEEEREAALLELKVAFANAAGRTREIDRKLFRLLEKGAGLDPDDPDDKIRIAEHLDNLREVLDLYRAAAQDFRCSSRELNDREHKILKLVEWEASRLER